MSLRAQTSNEGAYYLVQGVTPHGKPSYQSAVHFLAQELGELADVMDANLPSAKKKAPRG